MYEKLPAELEPATYCLPQKSPDFRGPRRRNQQVFRLSANLYYKEKRARLTGSFLFGATGRTRTGDLLFAPKIIRFSGTPKKEPPFLTVDSYLFFQNKKSSICEPFLFWSYWPDSNRRPADYESAALPTEPQ